MATIDPGTPPAMQDVMRAGMQAMKPANFDINTLPAQYAQGTDPSYQAFQNAITGSSGYLGWKMSAGERADQAAAARRAALQALVVQYGGLPSGFVDPYGDITSEISATAAANPFSENAKLTKAYGENVSNFQRSLAARGALQSGDLGYGLGQLDYQNSADRYTTAQDFLNQAQGDVNSYAGTLVGLKQEQIQALRDAAGAVFQGGYRFDPSSGQYVYDPNAGANPYVTGGGAGGDTGGSPGAISWTDPFTGQQMSTGSDVRDQAMANYSAMTKAGFSNWADYAAWLHSQDTPPVPGPQQPTPQAPPVAPTRRYYGAQ